MEIVPQNMISSITHIGSTAINNIHAKDIIDILVETNSKKVEPNFKYFRI